MEYLTRSKQLHAKSIQPFKGVAVGASFSEISALEESVGFKLPEAYKEYLYWMGKDYRGIFVGCEWFIDCVSDCIELIPELLEENGIQFTLPEHYLGFFSHQGYMAAWFELPIKSEDPEVWYYSEGKEMKFPENTEVFSEFLYTDMEGIATCLQNK